MPINLLNQPRQYFNRLVKHSCTLLGLLLIASLSFSVNAQEDVLQESQSINMTTGTSIDDVSIDINTANASQLATLANIGLKKAKEIIAYREVNGLFVSIDDLSKVKGIGSKTVEKNRHRIQIANK
jgi:competence protein ComEA